MGQLEESLSLFFFLSFFPCFVRVNSERKIGETRTISMLIVTTSLVGRLGFVNRSPTRVYFIPVYELLYPLL